MCELFGVSTPVPVRILCSLEEFAKHGGGSHMNRSGWGVAYYEGKDVLLVRQALPAVHNPWIKFLETHGLSSHCTIAHVRHATFGEPTLVNTHPFRRELGGRMHIFAHNGSLPDIEGRLPFEREEFRPVGETDSEHAFCLLLQRLTPLWRAYRGDQPSLAERLDVVTRTAADLRKLGAANFLYSDGDVLFAHGHRRRYDRDGVFGPPEPPGLWIGETLETAHMFNVSVPTAQTRGVTVASVPLTRNGWTPLAEGAVVALRDGALVARTEA